MFSHSNIAEVWNDRNGICTIISDDGFLDSGLLLNELCKKTQLHATIAGTVCFIEPNLKIWQNIEREGYLELVNHSYSHIPMNSFSKRTDEQAQLRHEILDAKAFYEEHFSTPAFTYVPPYNDISVAGNRFFKENGIFAVRCRPDGNNPLSPKYGEEEFNWLNLGMHDIGGGGYTTADRNSWVEVACQKHQWTIEMWHDVCRYKLTHCRPIWEKDAMEHLTFLAEKQSEGILWVAHFTKAAAYLHERQHCALHMLEQGPTQVRFSVDFTDAFLPRTLFTFPLTVKAYLKSPQAAPLCCVRESDNRKELLPVRQKSSEAYVLFDLVPGGQRGTLSD